MKRMTGRRTVILIIFGIAISSIQGLAALPGDSLPRCACQRIPDLFPTESIQEKQFPSTSPVIRHPSRLPAGSLEIVVDTHTLRLSILVNRQEIFTFPVAIGKKETPSPVGDWFIVHKGYWAKGKSPWLGLSAPFGIYGIHGTGQPGSIGHRSSNGCIRMFNHHIEQVYRLVNVGTPVHIIGDPFGDRRLLKRGMAGSDVYFLQIRLKQLGYLKKKANGYFEYWTQSALKKCQAEMGLPVTGEMSRLEYHRLRLYWTD